jgi:hypothetical protein
MNSEGLSGTGQVQPGPPSEGHNGAGDGTHCVELPPPPPVALFWFRVGSHREAAISGVGSCIPQTLPKSNPAPALEGRWPKNTGWTSKRSWTAHLTAPRGYLLETEDDLRKEAGGVSTVIQHGPQPGARVNRVNTWMSLVSADSQFPWL